MLDSTQLESTLSSLVAWAKTRGRVLLSIAVRGALQLLLSFIFSVFLYRALYQVRPARPTPPPHPPQVMPPHRRHYRLHRRRRHHHRRHHHHHYQCQYQHAH